ncbi:hypothetical protein STRDD04_01705 [Streptococcus sp. DD04]|nr:hypothetical protein STRDD04_01705 [Streptococcus sp. DD04]
MTGDTTLFHLISVDDEANHASFKLSAKMMKQNALTSDCQRR